MAAVAPAPGTSAPPRWAAPAAQARAKLRVGVFADRATQPRWIVEALARIAACDFAEIALLGVGEAPAAARESAGWRAYRAIDRWAFGEATDWSAPCNLAQLVPAARRRSIDGALVSAWRSAADHPLDVAFAVGAVDDALLEGIARYGVWRYNLGAAGSDDALAAVREVIEAAPVVASGIRIRAGAGGERIACASWSRTVPFSLARSREGVLPKSAEFLARALRDLHAFGPAWLEQGTVPADWACPGRNPRAASVVDAARLAWRVGLRAVEHGLTVGQWQLALRFGSAARWAGSLEGFTRLAPPRDRFWADPFPLEVNGRHYIFFEELPFAAGKAHISVIEVDERGRASEPRRVLERDYHLSYPFLVEDGGTLYMIPETAHNRTVEIYRCVEFPWRWKLERALLADLCAVDATLHRAGERWWMFANVGRDVGGLNDELALFSADRLLGEWRPHRGNPVKSDVRAARPAGRLFMQGDALYRPAQICTPLYGSGIVLHRVARLDEGGFEEREERRIVPAAGEGILGLHTLNRAGALTVTDAFVRRRRF